MNQNNQKNQKIEKKQSNVLLEFGPIACFVITYFYGAEISNYLNLQDSFLAKPIFIATLTLMVVTPAALAISWVIYRTLPIMPIITIVVVSIFGALTLYFQDDYFIKIKPTIINCIFATILVAGLMFDKIFLQMILGSAFELNHQGWKKLTVRWSIFFVFLAIVNEIVWRNFSEAFWVSFKLWGMTGLSFIFIASQMPMIMRHSIKQENNP